jgi:hypothetical protein
LVSGSGYLTGLNLMFNFVPSKHVILNIPFFGRVALVRDRGGSANWFPGGLGNWGTNLTAEIFHDGKSLDRIDCGSGLVTNVGAMGLMHEAVTLASPSAARVNVLFLANQHFSGTGATAAAATDIKIQTISTNGGQTAVAGTQTYLSTANSQIYQTVATIAYTGTEAVIEWGLHTSATRTSTTGSPFTAATASSWTDTGSVQTASSTTVQGLQQFIAEAGTTTVWGMTDTNTTHVITLVGDHATTGWWKTADGTAGSTPGNTETFTVRPILWDHKVFSAINVNNGDSIQFTYKLTISSGG